MSLPSECGVSDRLRSHQSVSARSRLQNHPPPEVLRIIFLYALPSTGTLKYSTIYGPASSEYDIKRAIISVCRFWWDVGIDLLYKEVIIHRADSLAFLLRTLVSPGSHVGRLIKKMVISCIVPFGDNLTVFEESMNHIVASCPSLSNLVIDPSFQHVSKNTTWGSMVPHSLRISDGALNIRQLDWGYYLGLDDLVFFLQHCPNLESLHFHLHDSHYLDFQKAVSTSVLLPHLQELQFDRHNMGHAHNPIEHAESTLGAQWSMPRLQRFTYNNSDALGVVDMAAFCQMHGGSLQYLHLGPDWRKWTHTVQGILDRCPALEHLVLWMSGNLQTICSLAHPKIMWVDIWVEMPSTLKILDAFLQTKPRGLLSLDRVRVFDNALWRPHAADLPSRLPPTTTALEDGFEYNYIGLNIKQKGNLIFQSDVTWRFFDGGASTSDEGSDFSEDSNSEASGGENTSDDDDSSSSGEESSAFDCDAEELKNRGRSTMEHELALASFLSILES